MSTVLDYSHYVEVVDQEECGAFMRLPTDVERPVDHRGFTKLGCLRIFDSISAAAQDAEYFYERLELFGESGDFEHCPHCAGSLEVVFNHFRALHSIYGRVRVAVCSLCGWWEHSDEYELREDGDYYRSREIRRRALLREFSVGGSEAPTAALCLYLQKHPAAIHDLSPRRLERLVEEVWKDTMACEAVHVGGPNDQGIDVLLIDGERRYAVQVKRRESGVAAESVRTIREFVGALVLAGEVRGIVVTTAPRFSAAAHHAASMAARMTTIETIDLVDGRRFLDVCKFASAGLPRPWEVFVRDLAVTPVIEQCFPVVPVAARRRSAAGPGLRNGMIRCPAVSPLSPFGPDGPSSSTWPPSGATIDGTPEPLRLHRA
jgi:hypothetical protein